MNNMLHKELKLSIHRFFFLMPVLTGALILIPNWPYFIAFMYFFFISVPNIYSTYNAQNDMGFSIMMAGAKKEIVKGKILSFCFLELLHIGIGAIFTIARNMLYGVENFLMDPNFAFFGMVFIMFALFNLVFFPLYFKTAFNYGLPTILANIVVIAFVAVLEILTLLNGSMRKFFEWSSPLVGVAVLLAGIGLFVLSNLLTYRISSRRFDKIDL